MHLRAPNFTFTGIEMWDCAPKIVKIGNFWYKFANNRRRISSAIVTKFGVGEGVVGPLSHATFHRYSFIYCPKIVKICNYWYKFARKENPGSAQKYLNIDALLETFFYATVG